MDVLLGLEPKTNTVKVCYATDYTIGQYKYYLVCCYAKEKQTNQVSVIHTSCITLDHDTLSTFETEVK